MFAGVEGDDHPFEHFTDGLVFELAVGGGLAVIGDQVFEGIGVVITDRGIKGDGADGGGAPEADTGGGDPEFLGQFLIGGFAAEQFLQLIGGASHAGDFIDQMDGEPDGFPLVGEGAFDGLFDPPGGVGGELAALGGVEAFDGFHQADVAFVDEVEEGEAVVLVIAGDFDDQAEVGLDHVFAGAEVAGLDTGGEGDFLLRSEQGDLADLAQIQSVGGVPVVAIPAHRGGIGGGVGTGGGGQVRQRFHLRRARLWGRSWGRDGGSGGGGGGAQGVPPT